jgi:cell wall-associated NlpC family hydrolase
LQIPTQYLTKTLIMRWLAYFILLSFLTTSCRALRPVSAPVPVNEGHPEGPRFIDGISINNDGSAQSAFSTSRAGENHTNTGNSLVREWGIEQIQPYRFKYAILMDVAVEQLGNSRLFEFIEDWYGTKYHFGGNSKEGIDCSAFASNLMSYVFGVDLPRMAKEQFHACQRIQKNNMQEGDLVFFHTTRRGISHVGVFLGNNKFVHASLNYGVTISDLNDPYYSRKFVGAGRAKTVQSGAISAR